MFWGLTIEPGKHYTQTVEESFHVSMAALETRLEHVTESGLEKSGVVQVIVKHEKAEFLLCSLFYGTVFQQPLDLNFTEGEEVTFCTEGRGIVHLTGYLVKEEPLDIDQDMMSLEDASSSEDIDVSSEGMASGEESSTQPQMANKPRKRKKKRTRWKSRDGDRRSGLHRHRRKRRRTEKGDCINPQRMPHQKSGDAKETDNPISVHVRKWTTTVVANVRTENDRTSNSEEVRDDGRTLSLSSNIDVQKSLEPQIVVKEQKGPSSASSPLGVKEQTSDSDVDKVKDRLGASSSSQQGVVIGSVLQETISMPSPKTPVRTEDFTPPPAITPVRTKHFTPPPPVSSKDSEPMPNVNQSTQNVETVQSSTPSTSQSASSVHTASITAQPITGATRTNETIQEVVTGGSSSRSGNESVKEEEEEEEVLIEEIKIEDDSDEEVSPPFSSSSISAASSSMPTHPTLPRITSVTSMSSHRQQQLLGDPRIDMMPHHHFQEPASWNIPGPSRAGMSSSQHGGSLLPEQFIPPVPLPPPQDGLHHHHQASHPLVPVGLVMHAADEDVIMGHHGGEMGDMEDEEGEAILSEEVLAAMPVATEMGEMGPDDLQIDGVDISQQQILLARGYRVFLTRGQLYDVQISARETTKTPWSVCVRRLMDIYFDRQTLAMGKATSHGVSSNPARKTLNQEVIQAIKDEDEADMSLQQLANEDLEDDDSEEEEEWSPKSGKKRPVKKKKPKKGVEEAVGEDGSPSKRKRHGSGDADVEWVMWNQPPVRKSAKKARKTMAIAMATKQDQEKESGDEDANGKPEKINKGLLGSADEALMVANLEDLVEDEDDEEDEDYVPGKKNQQTEDTRNIMDTNVSTEDGDEDNMVTNLDDEEEDDDGDDEDYVPGRKKNRTPPKHGNKDNASKKDKKKKDIASKKDEQAILIRDDESDEDDDDDEDYVPGNDTKKKKKVKKPKKSKGNDVEIVEVDPAAVSSTSKTDEEEEDDDDDVEGDDEDYVPDKKLLKKTTKQSESESDSGDERKRRKKQKAEEAEFEEEGESDDSYDSEEDAEFEGEEEEESDEEDEDFDGEEDLDSDEGEKIGQKQQEKQKGSKLQENKNGSNKKPNNKKDKKGNTSLDQGAEGISSDKENMLATTGNKGKNAAQELEKKEQKKKPKQMKLKGGITAQDLVVGTGKVAKPGRKVFVYYRGRLESNNKQFDACQSGPPFDFRLGAGEVIKGWDTGVADQPLLSCAFSRNGSHSIEKPYTKTVRPNKGMKVGGKRLIIVPPSQGYGNDREGPIPPNSTLVFEVELKNVK